MTKGECLMSITDEQFIVDETHPMLDNLLKPAINPETKLPYTWWDMRPFMIQIPYYGYTPLKKWIIVQCKKSGQCDKQISSWDRTLNNIDTMVVPDAKPVP